MATSISVYGYKKAFTILLIIISILTIAVIGVGISNAVYYNISSIINPHLHYQSNNNNQCSHAFHAKMFDSKIAPKYIIGKDYKIISVNPATTDVLVNGCTLAPVDISQ